MTESDRIKLIIRTSSTIKESNQKLRNKIIKNEPYCRELDNLMTDCVEVGLERGKTMGTVKTEIKYVKACDWDIDKVYPSGSLKD